MREVPRSQLIERIRDANPWWQSGAIEPSHQKAKPRAYLELFVSLLAKESPRRAVILMGPRRVGKTWLLHHTVQWLIQQGTNPRSICYVDVQIPLFNGIGLENSYPLPEKPVRTTAKT